MRDKSSIKIHQIYFRENQLSRLDDAFCPYDNSGSSAPQEFEFAVFKKEYANGSTRGPGYKGYISWKFGAKTGVSGRRFIDFCEANPGYDAYFINPFPLQIRSGTVWEQGELCHPELKSLTQHILDELNYNIQLDELPVSLRTSAFCNYWVGNERFWDAYMKFCTPIYEYIRTDLKGPHLNVMLSKADKFRRATYFPFIFERLFSTFIATHPEFKVLSFQYSLAELQSKYFPFEALLINEVQRLEVQNSDQAQPLSQNPVLLKALKDYGKGVDGRSLFRFGLHRFTKHLRYRFSERFSIRQYPRVHRLMSMLDRLIFERNRHKSSLLAYRRLERGAEL